jgi:glucose-1-phosphate thymidylyltransferase
MKGIILAGGSGTRLHPVTKSVSKQLLPIYNKPMIFYPLSTLMLSGIREILIISTPHDIKNYELLLGDGNNYGLDIKYKIQKEPRGLAEAFIIGEDFIKNDDVCLILGDNIFYGKGLPDLLKDSVSKVLNGSKSIVFGYNVSNPSDYGVVEFNHKGEVISIEEKPKVPKSNYAVVGLYFYKNDVVNISKNIKPSKRGELEITSVNNKFLENGSLHVQLMSRGFAWLDTGTHDSLLEASNFIKTIETRQGLKISCIEEIAYKYGYIDKIKLKENAKKYNNEYGDYLMSIIDD